MVEMMQCNYIRQYHMNSTNQLNHYEKHEHKIMQ